MTSNQDFINHEKHLDMLNIDFLYVSGVFSPKQDKAVPQYCGRITFGSIYLYLITHSEFVWCWKVFLVNILFGIFAFW